MKSLTSAKIAVVAVIAVGLVIVFSKSDPTDKTNKTVQKSSPSGGSTLDSMVTVDDFSDTKKNSFGVERQFIDDTSAGGATTTSQQISNGILTASGEITPPRGQPGWASVVLILDPNGQPKDMSASEGIRLLVRVNQGNLSVSANSSEITNFDYHAATVTPPNDGAFHEVKIPFTDMKRTWSAQTALDPKTLVSISLVAFDMQAGAFDFDFDEVSFY